MDVIVSCFLEPSTLSCCMNFYLAFKSMEYSHNDKVEFKLGRKMIVYLLVDCYEVRKKEKK